MARAYSYLRFSTPEQATGDSFERQLRLSRQYAEQAGLVLDEGLTFHDLGVSAYSGKNAETGRLSDFLIAVRSGLVPHGSFLLVESLDRISRQSARKALNILNEIVDEEITLVTLNDQKTYSADILDQDPMALLIAILVFMRANEESLTKSLRLKSSWARKRKDAALKPISARGPAWLRLNVDRSGWDIIEDRARIVKQIFVQASVGQGELRITQELNRLEIATWGDNGRAPARMWHKSYVSKILRSRSVIGILTPFTQVRQGRDFKRRAEVPVPGYYPPIVDLDLWERVQSIKATRSPLRGKHANNDINNIAAGFTYCALCDCSMTRVTKGKKGGPAKLICTSAKNGNGCLYRPVSIDKIEQGIHSFFQANAKGLGDHLVRTSSRCAESEEPRVKFIDIEIENIMSVPKLLSYDLLVQRLQELVAERHQLIVDAGFFGTMNLEEVAKSINNKALELQTLLGKQIWDKKVINAKLRQLFKRFRLDPTTGELTLETQFDISPCFMLD